MGKKKGSSKQHVEVIARSRPLNRKELDEGCGEYCVTPGADTKGGLAKVKLHVEAGDDAPGIPGPAGTVQTYQFSVDRAFYEDDDNAQLYDYLGGRVLDRAFSGYHACLLAYGQTGSGKTHTILGDKADPGIIPRLSADIFERVAASELKTEVVVEMVEIYGKEERMSDLLSDSKWGADSNLKLRQHDPTSFYVQGTKAYQPTDSAQMDIFVQAGVDKRTVAETNMNHQSSRSHSILTISIRQHMKSGTLREGKIRLVDLAGSENLDRSGAQGQQANEAIAINASLSVLRRVLTALADKKEHVPFRDSVLTKLLADSLTGNSMTTIITTVSPAKSNAAESKSTLGYGATARKIKTQPVVNDSDEKWKVKELEAEVERLRNQAKGGGAGGGGGMSEADALAMAERMLAKERAAQESELQQLQRETRERLERMKATQAKLAAASANQQAEMAQEKEALQQKVDAVDERERRLLELEARLAAREAEMDAREEAARGKQEEDRAATVLASLCRAKLQVASYAELLPRVRAVRVLQSFARCWRARRELQRRRRAAFFANPRTQRAAVTLQSGWRGRVGRVRAGRVRAAWTRQRQQAAVHWQSKQVEMKRQVQQLNAGETADGGRGGERWAELEPEREQQQPQPRRKRTPPWLSVEKEVSRESLPNHVEAAVRRKGAELDAKAAKARKRSSRRKPGAALAGDFAQLQSMFGALDGKPKSRASSASSYAVSTPDEPSPVSSVYESRSQGDVPGVGTKGVGGATDTPEYTRAFSRGSSRGGSGGSRGGSRGSRRSSAGNGNMRARRRGERGQTPTNLPPMEQAGSSTKKSPAMGRRAVKRFSATPTSALQGGAGREEVPQRHQLFNELFG